MTDQQHNLSDAKIFDLLEQANQQYDEYVRLTEIPDFAEQPEEPQPLYSWANPIGLVITSPDSHPTSLKNREDARLV